jgi:hypothetical protein
MHYGVSAMRPFLRVCQRASAALHKVRDNTLILSWHYEGRRRLTLFSLRFMPAGAEKLRKKCSAAG